MLNASSAPHTDASSIERDGSIERLLRRQRVLAWSLSLLMLTTTVGFFALMSLDAPILSHIAFGRAVTVSNVAAVAVILMSLLSIAIFGWQARRIDAQLDRGKRS
jgi:uncharacterized membrane protein (DUF485 family)